jgi:hypothetical protein
MREVFIAAAIMGTNPRIRTVRNATGSPTPITFSDSNEVSKRTVHTLLAAEGKSGRTLNLAALSKPGGPPQRCDVHSSSTGQQAAYWMKDRKVLTPGGRALLDHLLASCKPEDYNGLSVRGYRIDLMLTLATAAPGAPQAMDWLREAMADSDAIFAQRPDSLHIGWKKSDLPRLENTMWAVVSASKTTMPMDEWFTDENRARTMTATIIASQLDAAYAQNLAPAGPSVFKEYRGVLSYAYAAAKLLPEPKSREARKLLYRAAHQHARRHLA